MRIHNFSAGPATLPLSVLETIQKELLDFRNTGMSIMEMSHRSKDFVGLLEEIKARFVKLTGLPDTHDLLFLQGGASLQFSMVPMNLYLENKPVDFIHTGVWTKKALAELKKIGAHNMVATGENEGFLKLPRVDNIQLNPDASYVYMCSNNTIYGTQWQTFPDTKDVPLVADMSSDILSKPMDFSKFGLVFAGAQKNLGPSGVTLVVIRKDLVERTNPALPSMLQYGVHLGENSLYNTPPTFGIYVLGLVLKWIEDQGGLEALEKTNQKKAKKLYDFIDEHPFYTCPVDAADRSLMNAVFRVTSKDEALEKQLVSEADKAGISGIKGHRLVGGLRASIYNALEERSIDALIQFLNEFAKKNG